MTATVTASATESLVRGLLETVDAGQWSRMLTYYTPNAVYWRPGYPAITGHDGLLRFYQRERVIASGRHTVSRILTAGDQGFCWGTFRGTSRAGAELTEQFADWYAFADGRIAERRTFFHRPAI